MAIWLIWGAVWLFTHETGDAIWFFSVHRSPFGDHFFKWITHLGEGLTFVVIILAALFFSYRNALAITLTGLTVVLTSFLSKKIFGHYRPAAVLRNLDEWSQIQLVEGVDLHTGATSFPSGHTMAAFALFSLLAFQSSYKRLLSLLFFSLALSVAVSRVYLVQHFVKDVYAGSVFGLLLAMLFYALQQRYFLNRSA